MLSGGWELPEGVLSSKSTAAHSLSKAPPVPMKTELGSSEGGY